MDNPTTAPILKAAEGAALTISSASPATGNHIYFYEGVSQQSCLNLIRQIRDCDLALRQHRLQYDLDGQPATPIWLHIQSYGGDVLAGLGVADQIRLVASPVHSIVEGSCCSAATLISMACDRRTITANSYLLIHQFFSVMWGTYEQFKDDMKMQDMLIKQLIAFYAGHSKLKPEKVAKLLKHDSWFNAGQALKAGLVDEIL